MARQLVLLAWLWAAAVGLHLCQAATVSYRIDTSPDTRVALVGSQQTIGGTLRSNETGTCSGASLCTNVANAQVELIIASGPGEVFPTPTIRAVETTDSGGRFDFIAVSSAVGRTTYNFAVTLSDGSPVNRTFTTVTIDWVNIAMEPESLDATITSKVLVKATYEAEAEQPVVRHPTPATAKLPTPTVASVDVEGVNVTFYRTDNTNNPPLPPGTPIGWALTDKNGVASLLIDGFAPDAADTRSAIVASLEASDGTVLTSAQTALIDFRQPLEASTPPSIEVSNTTVALGEDITVTVTARDRNGAAVQGAEVTFNVQGPASLTVIPVPPGAPPPPRQAPRRAVETVVVPTDAAGQAAITISSTQDATASVSSFFFLNEYEQVPLENAILTFGSPPPDGVTSILLKPDSQTVRVGRYAQLTATLTPALQGVKVDFTATRVTPMEAELDGATDDTDALFWSEPDTTIQQAQLESDPSEPGNAEVAYHKRPGGNKNPTQKASALSNAQGVATVSLWQRRPGTYRVRASVTNADNTTVTSNAVEVEWVADSPYGSHSPYGRSEGPYYKTHPGRDDHYPGDNTHGYKHRPEDYRGSKGGNYKHGKEQEYHGGKHSEGPYYKKHGGPDDYSAKHSKGHKDTYRHAKHTEVGNN